MCNLGEALVEISIEKGKEIGIEKGKEIRDVELIGRMMNNLKKTYDEVVTLMGMSEEEVEKYRRLIWEED